MNPIFRLLTKAARVAAFSCALTAKALGAGGEPASITEELQEQREKHKQPAMAAAVFTSDDILAVGAVGERILDRGESVTVDDLFHLGSCTKAITSTMIATLVEEGVLWWDMPLERALPEIAEKMHDEYRGATLAQLLQHRAGVPPFTAGNAPEFQLIRDLKGPGMEQRRILVERLLTRKPDNPPGLRFVYSNADYAIAAAIAERATGQTWEELLAERIFGPLELTSAGFGWPATPDRPDQPLGHMPAGQGVSPLPPEHPYRLQACLAPAGDVHASVTDFARFAQFHLAGIRGATIPALGRDHPLVSHRQFMKLHLPEGEYAMGWAPGRHGDAQLTWHNGSAGTFFALMTLDPDHNIGVVVVTNAGTGAKACDELTRALMARFTGKSSGAASPENKQGGS